MDRRIRALGWTVIVLSVTTAPWLDPRAALGEETAAPKPTAAIRSSADAPDDAKLEENASAPLSLSWSMGFASKYLFQGIDYSAGEPVLNPEIGVTAGGFTASVWINHDLHESVSNEYDLAFQYGRDLGSVSVALGYMYLRYPHRVGWDPSQEMFVDFGLVGPLSPSLSVHYDFDAGKGIYNTLGISRSLATPLSAVSLGANLFYQNNYYETTGIPAFELNAGAEYPLGPFSVTPSVARFLSWENGDFRGETAVPSSWLFSLGIGYSL